jgi:LacI family transcriptional regulator
LVVARAVEARVGTRRTAGARVPSVRELAAEHGVSTVTALRALQVLRDKGVISTLDRSGSFLASPTAEAAEHWALCLRPTAGPWQQASGSVGRRGFETAARQQGFTLDAHRFEFGDDLTPREARRQVKAARDDGVGGVFFMPSRATEEGCRADETFLAACRAAELAVVLVERNLRGVDRALEHDLVASDDVFGGTACTRHLLEAGCRRVALVIASPTSTHQDRLAGYLYALYSAGGECSPLVLNEPSDRPPKEAYASMAEQLLAASADGVVCYQDYTAMGLILEFLARGRSVPREVAIAGFDDLPVGKSFAIGVTTYAYPTEMIACEALDLMRRRVRAPDTLPVKVAVPGRLMVRESSRRA